MLAVTQPDIKKRISELPKKLIEKKSSTIDLYGCFTILGPPKIIFRTDLLF